MASGDWRDALNFDPIGAHVTDAVISTAAALTPPTGATKILIQALSQNVRFTLDGSTPTAAIGFQLAAGDPPIVIPLGTGMTIKVIEEAATASLQYQWGS